MYPPPSADLLRAYQLQGQHSGKVSRVIDGARLTVTLGRDKAIYNPWHYLAVLERKPGALRNGAPFKRWELPEAMSEVRTALEGRSGGDRQFVSILSVVSRYGLEPVAVACSQALADKTVSSDVILSILSRTHDEPQPEPAKLPEQLPLLKLIPMVNCYRYDSLMKGGAYGTA